ncbi:hypothetical protein C8Q76DRAFT_796623 [Earliella scabrosa]|nr:hypothetical protein C8Q76DRAFT_796623 [Earliella scabrosa]
MLFSHLIIALSVSFAPLAQGRPARQPAASSSPDQHQNQNHASVEPGTLLGRRYVVQEHREPTRLPRAVYAGYASPAGYRTAEAPRHSKPFAQYLAERGRRADGGEGADSNLVSHVGPFAPPAPPVEPAQPARPYVAVAEPTAPSAPPAPVYNTTGPVLNAQTNSTSTSVEPKKTKSAKGKSKVVTHKEGKVGGQSSS